MSYQIFIKGNNTFTVQVTQETLIDDLHQYIKIPKDLYYFVFGCKVLDNGSKLKEYSINSESTIHIHLRASGNPVIIKKN